MNTPVADRRHSPGTTPANQSRPVLPIALSSASAAQIRFEARQLLEATYDVVVTDDEVDAQIRSLGVWE